MDRWCKQRTCLLLFVLYFTSECPETYNMARLSKVPDYYSVTGSMVVFACGQYCRYLE